jgi:hypothetical protein
LLQPNLCPAKNILEIKDTYFFTQYSQFLLVGKSCIEYRFSSMFSFKYEDNNQRCLTWKTNYVKFEKQWKWSSTRCFAFHYYHTSVQQNASLYVNWFHWILSELKGELNKWTKQDF